MRNTMRGLTSCDVKAVAHLDRFYSWNCDATNEVGVDSKRGVVSRRAFPRFEEGLAVVQILFTACSHRRGVSGEPCVNVVAP